ncbi:MAG: hisN [Mycobacterium sp.]|jgi:histidinol-phosphatase|nr:hisN [Mycobacterium sp.]
MNRTADDLKLALALAQEADSLTMPRFGALGLYTYTASREEEDPLPFTDPGHDVEVALREKLAFHHPDDSIFGEELGGAAKLKGREWVIEPIDGAKNFTRRVPVWATLIALLSDGVPAVGVVSAPALQRRWWAAAGHGAFAVVGDESPRRLRVSSVADLPGASLSFSSLSGWAVRGLREQFLGLTDEVWRARAYGDFWSYCLVAEGAVDIATEPLVPVWDLAALDVLVREAGGAFSGLDGTPGPHGGSAVATNGLLHESVLTSLSAV